MPCMMRARIAMLRTTCSEDEYATQADGAIHHDRSVRGQHVKIYDGDKLSRNLLRCKYLKDVCEI